MPPSPRGVPEGMRPSTGAASVDMTVQLAGLTLRCPVMTASGTFASGHEYAEFVELERLGAIVTKGVSLEPWPGNDPPRIAETPSGMLNSIGLQNQGVEKFCEKQLVRLRDVDVPVIVNVSGHSIAVYAAVIERLERESGVAGYEVNISCPNVDEGGMAFGVACAPATAVTRAVRSVTSRPLIVKLSPNVTDIAEIARAVEAEGADAVSLINTLLGMAIDPETRRPRLARVVGGLSGPAIKPVALRHHDGRGRRRVHAGRCGRGRCRHRELRRPDIDPTGHRRSPGVLRTARCAPCPRSHWGDGPVSAPVRERVIVALDQPDAAAALACASALKGRVRWVKVGMTLFYAEGPAVIAAVRDLGFDVFLDLKLHDIPHQVERGGGGRARRGLGGRRRLSRGARRHRADQSRRADAGVAGRLSST